MKVTDAGFNPLVLMEMLQILCSDCGSLCWVWGLFMDSVSVSLTHFDVAFVLRVPTCRNCRASFGSFCLGNHSLSSYSFRESMGQAEFKVLLMSLCSTKPFFKESIPQYDLVFIVVNCFFLFHSFRT